MPKRGLVQACICKPLALKSWSQLHHREGIIMHKRKRITLAIGHSVAIGSAGLVVGIIPHMAMADNVTNTGDGTVTATGTLNADGSSGSGTAASAPTVSDPTNAMATAIAQGFTLNPNPGEKGGDATAGSNAISSSSSNAISSATAIGGDGTPAFLLDGTSAGDGGDAQGLAVASAGSAPALPNATASVDVEGGFGTSSASGNGGNGGFATIPLGDVVQATAPLGVATATAYVVGGSGGTVYSDNEFLPSSLPSPHPGIGQSVEIGNTVAGSGVTVILSQTAVGGAGGGNEFGGGFPGATSISALDQTSVSNAGTLTATTIATAGSGGFGGGGFIFQPDNSFVLSLGAGGAGADATAETILGTVGSPVTANANASGGNGGDSVALPGQGGNATAIATAGTGGAGVPATATAVAQGGAGGNLANDAGTSAYISGGPGADGGFANANANANPFTGLATATATATGGNGGTAQGENITGDVESPFVGGAGGLAVASVSGGSIFEDLMLTATARGGTGGGGLANGVGGDATAIILGSGTGMIEQFSPGLADGQGGFASLSVGSGTIFVGSPVNPVMSRLNVTIPGSLKISGAISGGNLVVGDGTNSTILQLQANTGVSSLSSLMIGANSTLDITNNHLIINYADGTQAATDAAIRGYLINGYNGGTWTGSSGLAAGGSFDSSTAANPANNSSYGLGYADGADGVVAGLSSGQIEVKYTLYGDANLDGVVSGIDFTILVGNLGKVVSGWDRGDFNYDGVVSGVDFTLLVGNLGKAANGADIALPAADLAAIDAFGAANGLMADVPEPASVSLLVMIGAGMMARRRRRSGRPH
jgi:hypothetical protein